MKTKNQLLTGLLGTIIIALAVLPLAHGDEYEAELRKQAEIKRIEREFENFRSNNLGEITSPMIKNNQDRLLEIRSQLDTELLEFNSTSKISEEAEQKLSAIRNKIGTISGQTIALQIAIDSTRQELELIKMQTMKRISDLKLLAEEKERMNAEKEIQKNAVMAFFALLQTENQEFGIDDDLRSVLRLLLSDETFSQNYWEAQQISALEVAGRKIFYDLEAAEKQLEEVSRIIMKESQQLSDLHTERSAEEKRLAEQIAAKKYLKSEVEKSEDLFENLLLQSKHQMEETALQIMELQQDRESMEEKIQLLEEADRKQRLQLAEKRRNQLQDQEEDYAIGEEFINADSEKTQFSWPVIPQKGISAFFLDKAYEKIFSVAHKAIDIPVSQGTTVLAPALGYVYKVTDNGKGYSSIIIAHKENFMTVYGHVSGFLVKEGDLVHTGDPIALSGGMPGTAGAGWMTTGPHLHFEVYRDGEQVDPLDYLPVAELPKKFIPDRFLDQIESNQTDTDFEAS